MKLGVTAAELAKRYPRLYHMAHRGNWEGIQRHGLLCTRALVEMCNVPAETRAAILDCQRVKSYRIEHSQCCEVFIRDQKPLIRSRLEKALRNCSFQQWLDMLNSRVFFWLTEARLRTLMCAREYCADSHVVLVVDTLQLVNGLRRGITLTSMNTGCVQPYAFPRSLESFYEMADYPFEERRRRKRELVVEFAVEGGVEHILDCLLGATEMRCSTSEKNQIPTINVIRKLFP